MIQTFFKRFALEIAVILALAVICAVEPGFLSMRNFRNILMIACPLMIMGVGFSICLINGIQDFSCASIASLAGVIAASLSQSEEASRKMFSDVLVLPLPAVLGITLVIALAAAVLHASFTSFGKVPSFVSSIALGGAFVGIISFYLELPEGGYRVLSGFSPSFSALGALFFGAIPLQALILLSLLAIFFVVMTQFKIGSYFNGVQNFNAPNKVALFIKLFIIFAFANILYTFAGCVEAARENRVGVGFWADALFSVVAGTLLGTVSVKGGKGTVIHSAIGIFLVCALQYALVFLGAQSGIQKILICALMVVSVIADRTQNARRATPFPLEQEKNPAE